MTEGAETYNIAIYARESRDDNYENFETIEAQAGLLEEFVRKNNLGRVVSIYKDDNVSGTIFERDGLNKLVDDITDKKINAIVMKDLSRLGRNNAKTLLFLDYLEEHKVRVITADSRYDSLKDNDTVGIETWANERYCRDLSRKIRATLRYKIEKGEYIGKAPYGYRKSGTERNKLVIDPLEADVVRRIYEMYCDGSGYLCIARKLNEEKIPSPAKCNSKNSRWSAAAIGRILTNRVYIGDTVQGVSEKINFKSKKTRRLSPDEWIITQNTHEPIIEIRLFEEAGKMRNSRKSFSGTHKNNIHLLSGIIFCGECGSAMYTRIRNRTTGYICGEYARRGKAACSSHYVTEDTISQSAAEYILGLLKDKRFYKECSNEIMAVLKSRFDDSTLKHLDSEMDRLQVRLETTYLDRLNGLISIDLYKKISSDITLQIDELKKKINKMNLNSGKIDADSIIKAFSDRLRQHGISRSVSITFIEKITANYNNNVGQEEISIYLKEGF